MLRIEKFTIEYSQYALGLDEKRPRFSWRMISDKTNVAQEKYRVIVVDEHGNTVWDSGEIESDTSVHIEYDGTPLKARTRYDATVTVWDNKGESAEATLVFETGLMRKPNGEFISHTLDESNVPEFVRIFDCKKQIKRARLYATALGVYETRINGKRVGDAYDAPGWTSYSNHLQYQTYDITDLLLESNEFVATVGEGWYMGALTWNMKTCIYGDTVAFCGEIHISYTDGSEEIIKTDKDWYCRPSKILSSSLYNGDTIDTTYEQGKLYPVKIVSYDGNILSQISEPVRVTEILSAKEYIVTPKGEKVIDFGQNLTGIVRFKIRGKRGQRVSIGHAEALDNMGNFYTANLRMAKCEDTYILDGNEQILQPVFTFHGFRYIRLDGFDTVEIGDFEALVLHTDMERTGTFECSDARINRLYENIVWSQRDNFFDIPSDCPQRDERLGWTGDAQVFCRTASFNYNVARFFKKWLTDLKAEQTLEKGVPHIVPNVVSENDRGNACWGDSATIIPWTIYEVYGDKRILSEQYESMRNWIEYIKSNSVDNLWQTGFQYGDWLALDREAGSSGLFGATDSYLIATAYYAYSTKIVAKTAEILDKTSDAATYNALYDEIVNAFRREYITVTGRVVSETQTSFVLLLYFGLIEEKFRAKIASALRRNLEEHNNHLVTGFVGTPYLMHALSENGLHDIAVKLMNNEDYPSWLYEVKMGATTIWERWNGIFPDGTFFEPSMSSFNHYAYGSVGDWLYKKLAGINAIEVGYKKILIRPYLADGLSEVSATFDSVYGKISVSYKIDHDKINYEIEIPVNTTAVLQLPYLDNISVGSGKYSYAAKLPVKSEG